MEDQIIRVRVKAVESNAQSRILSCSYNFRKQIGHHMFGNTKHHFNITFAVRKSSEVVTMRAGVMSGGSTALDPESKTSDSRSFGP